MNEYFFIETQISLPGSAFKSLFQAFGSWKEGYKLTPPLPPPIPPSFCERGLFPMLSNTVLNCAVQSLHLRYKRLISFALIASEHPIWCVHFFVFPFFLYVLNVKSI